MNWDGNRWILGWLCLVPTSTPAAELVRRDLVVTVQTLPADFDYDLSTPLADASGADSFSTAVAARIGGRWSWPSPGSSWAPVAGVDVRLGTAEYEDYGTYRLVGVGGVLGYGCAFADRWAAELDASIEIGQATLDLDSNPQFAAISGSGTYLGYGVRFGVLYALGDHWSVGAEVGYEAIASRIDADGGTDIDIDQSGLTGGLTVVYRWSRAPARLE